MIIRWLWLCWHPQAARLCIGADPARGSAAEGFSLGKPCVCISCMCAYDWSVMRCTAMHGK